jgi:hypothetical protein
LTVRTGFNCVTGACRFDVDFRVELIGESVPSSTSVTVDVSAAIATDLGDALPHGLEIDFTVDDGGEGGS